jgi:hypothetical protein
MKRSLFYITPIVIAMAVIAGCAMGAHYTLIPNYNQFMPNSIAVIPVMNDTVDMKAPDIVRPVVYQKVVNWGYESPSLQMIDNVLSQKHIHEAGEINQFTAQQLGEMFSVDAILYTTITDWSTTWLAVYASQTVGLKLELRSAKDDRLLWEGQYTLAERAIAGNKRQMAALAVISAISPYQPLVYETVNIIFRKLPYGPYHT